MKNNILGEKMPGSDGEISIWKLERVRDVQEERAMYEQTKIDESWPDEPLLGVYYAVRHAHDNADKPYFPKILDNNGAALTKIRCIFTTEHLIITNGNLTRFVPYSRVINYSSPVTSEGPVFHGALVLFLDKEDIMLFAMNGYCKSNMDGITVKTPGVDINSITYCIDACIKTAESAQDNVG